MTGGHGHFIGREADGVDAVRRAVRVEIKEGADFIKVMATGGVLTAGVDPNNIALLPEELAVVAQEAHNSGRRVTTHAIGNAGIRNALLAGIDSIEHGMHLDDPTLELALDRGAFLVPTLLAVSRIVRDTGPGPPAAPSTPASPGACRSGWWRRPRSSSSTAGTASWPRCARA